MSLELEWQSDSGRTWYCRHEDQDVSVSCSVWRSAGWRHSTRVVVHREWWRGDLLRTGDARTRAAAKRAAERDANLLYSLLRGVEEQMGEESNE